MPGQSYMARMFAVGCMIGALRFVAERSYTRGHLDGVLGRWNL